jgi:hypothetical protein
LRMLIARRGDSRAGCQLAPLRGAQDARRGHRLSVAKLGNGRCPLELMRFSRGGPTQPFSALPLHRAQLGERTPMMTRGAHGLGCNYRNPRKAVAIKRLSER